MTSAASVEAPTSAPTPVEADGFAALGVPARFVSVLAREGITTPFPIQSATLRDTLAGRDVLGRGRTGSGKTLAFVIPMIARLADGTSSSANRPRGLVLAPTRELATQIAAVVEPLAKAARLSVTTIYGGMSYARQISALRGGVDILIACPGRLEDLIKQGSCRLDAVEVTVLDEADHMADLGFLPGVKRLMDATPRNGQRMLFSATLDNGVDILVKRYLTNPLTHAVDGESTPVLPANHHMLTVATMEDKNAVVRELAAGEGRRLLFTRTKHGAKRWAKQLTADGVPAVDLHGNLNQNARDRNLKAFSEGQVRVLVATDIAARGIHVDDVVLVVHVDPPTEHKAYLHRSGRTARAGAGGDVVTLVLPNQRGEVKTLARQAGITPVVTSVGVGSPHVRSLVGPEAVPLPYTPFVVEPQQQSSRPRHNRGASGAGQGRG
ncbi:MAG: DEAD/DEAH box helicase, partial [Geodermatophilaceae bacterium]|nr:DEAD/DEAH box helicase [Geodermatophilaceae bacterium]